MAHPYKKSEVLKAGVLLDNNEAYAFIRLKAYVNVRRTRTGPVRSIAGFTPASIKSILSASRWYKRLGKPEQEVAMSIARYVTSSDEYLVKLYKVNGNRYEPLVFKKLSSVKTYSRNFHVESLHRTGDGYEPVFRVKKSIANDYDPIILPGNVYTLLTRRRSESGSIGMLVLRRIGLLERMSIHNSS